MTHNYGHILVVDDNQVNRLTLAADLEEQGHTIAMAENGRQALEILQTQSFDLVLLDIIMPEMNGYQVLEHMKHDSKLRDIPVVVISGVGETESVARCIGMGAEDYLSKPFEPVLLGARIAACLEKKHLHDQEQTYLKQLRLERERLRQRTVELKARNEELDAFAHTVAHDLKNPLNNIVGFADALENIFVDLPEEELRHYL